MSAEAPDNLPRYVLLDAELTASIKPWKDQFDGFMVTGEWEYKGDLPQNPYKITAIHQRESLFAKSFAPITRDYSQKMMNVLLQLRGVSSSVPVLQPIGYV